MLVRKLSQQGKNKLKDWWEDIPYLVMGRVGNLPVYEVQQEGTGKKRTLHPNLLLPYHVQPETLHTTVTTGTNPAPRTQSCGHPETMRLANVNSVGGHEELEPIVVITTEKTPLTLVLCPLVFAAREEQPLKDPPPEEVPIPLEEITQGAVELPAAGDPASDSPEDVQPPRAEDADLTDVVEPFWPEGGVTTRSGRVIHPLDRLISDSVWAQVRSVLYAWLGD